MQLQHPASDAAEAAPPQLVAPSPVPGVVLHGTCGWSDASLVRCGRFYPAAVKVGSSSEDKLRHYSRAFANVEVDTSTYAIPRPDVTARWAQAAAPGFLFHVKAFGLFCSQGCQVSALPAEAKALLLPEQVASPQAYLRLSAMPPGVEAVCWRRFHTALEPLYQAGKLGLVVFQFHLSFQPSQQNLQHILRCRAQLDARFRMAAEVRCRRWLTDSAWRQRLCEALSMQGITLVSADELAHETAQRDREQTGLPHGELRQVLPIALEVTTPGCHYVRIHRRFGTTERLLPPEEVRAWAARLEQLAPQLRGPTFFLWGTDHEDAPVRNARNLDEALPAALRCDWRQHCRSAAATAPPPRGSIQGLFRKQEQRRQLEGQYGQQQQAQTSAQGCSHQSDGTASGDCGAAAEPQQQVAGGAEPAYEQGAAPPRGSIQSLFRSEQAQQAQQAQQADNLAQRNSCAGLGCAFGLPVEAAAGPQQISSTKPSRGSVPARLQQLGAQQSAGGRKRSRGAQAASPGPAGRRSSGGGGGIMRFLQQHPPPAS